jgi:hypothetical protein
MERVVTPSVDARTPVVVRVTTSEKTVARQTATGKNIYDIAADPGKYGFSSSPSSESSQSATVAVGHAVRVNFVSTFRMTLTAPVVNATTRR